MSKNFTLLLLSSILLLSCAEKQDDAQEKAQNLLIEKYANIYASDPVFDFKYKIVKYDKEENGLYCPLLNYAAVIDDYVAENVGYVLKYIVVIDGITLVFVATFDENVEQIITNKLYENALFDGGGLVSIDCLIIK